MELKDKTKITFHNGILTIGGTVIEVTYQNATIYFDFGTEYRPELAIQNESFETLIEHHLIPELSGVYDPQLTNEPETTSDKNERAVFLSHVHLDHSKMINFLDVSIPLYTLNSSKKILEFLNRNGQFLLPGTNPNELTRDIIGLQPGEKITMGDISVEMIEVDHDAYGAAGLLIKTPNTTIAYTGDLRLHGYAPEKSLNFCKRAKGADLLIIEGVSISFDEASEETNKTILKEEELVTTINQLLMDNPDKQVTFNGYPANLQRFIQLAQLTERTVVLESEIAGLILEVTSLELPYYYREKSAFNSTLNSELEIPYESLLQDTTEYFWQVVADFDQLQPGGIYIHSNAQPLGAFDPNYDVFTNQLRELEITFLPLGCSGHAYPEDLNKIVSLIKPKLLAPIHSLHPERLLNPYGERVLPKRGETLYL